LLGWREILRFQFLGKKGVDPDAIIIRKRQHDFVIAVQVDNQIIFGPQGQKIGQRQELLRLLIASEPQGD